jgi:hypothetical protein
VSFVIDWRTAIARSGLPPRARLVAFALSLHMRADGSDCFPGLKTIVSETGLGRRTVTRAFEELVREGFGHRSDGERTHGRGLGHRGHRVVFTPLIPAGPEGGHVGHLLAGIGGHVDDLSAPEGGQDGAEGGQGNADRSPPVTGNVATVATEVVPEVVPEAVPEGRRGLAAAADQDSVESNGNVPTMGAAAVARARLAKQPWGTS